jgi:polysaccharide pyruvyl transferase WcaK-like protein
LLRPRFFVELPTQEESVLSLKDALRHRWSRLITSRRILEVEGNLARRNARRAGSVVQGSGIEQRRHLLVAAPGGGSVGDQAMFEAFLDSVQGPVTVFVRTDADLLQVPESERSRVLVKVLPHLLYGAPWRYLKSLRELNHHIDGARSLSVIGADVMDGVYNPASSVRRFRVVELAATRGLDARVLGFSWNARPAPEALDAMRAASRKAQLIARDPVSGARLRAGGAQFVEDSADLAFLAPAGTVPHEIEPWLEREVAAGRPLVVVNANYLLEKHFNQADVYSSLVSEMVEGGASVLLVPHDLRGPDSDLVIAKRIEARVDSPHVAVIDQQLLPGEVQAIASRVSFAITGRMHLAILCANVGTPAIALSYQGKIEGLYERLGNPYFVEPEASTISVDLRAAVDGLSESLSQTRETILDRLPSLRELALKNVDGLRD